MNNPKGTRPRGEPFLLMVFIVPSLLLLPAFYYSLATPFALVDDYGMCYYVEYLDSMKRFLKWAESQFLNHNHGRYRPFFDLYNMVTWKLFGAVSFQHHLSRWLLHFGALYSFSAAFFSFSTGKQDTLSENSIQRGIAFFLLPLSFLLYLWLYFPNSPVSRLGPQEINTVFFLGICNWMMARIILQGTSKKATQSLLLSFSVFYLGYLGLSFSKEINIAVMAWILVFYYSWLFLGFRWKKVLYGVPFIAIFAYSVLRVYIASKHCGYGVSPVTPELVIKNSIWIFKELFQVNTSNIITLFFVILFVVLLLFVGAKIIRRNFSGEVAFVLFLLGQFVSMYLIVCTSWAPVLRYWYVLIPIFTTLLAFSVKYLLEVTAFRTLSANIISIILASFIVFFIGCNYYNFMMQTMVQHSVRQAEKELISELSNLHDTNGYIHILRTKGDPEAELVAHLIAYYRRFSPRFFNKKYTIYTALPKVPYQTYYTVTMHEQAGDLEKYMTINNRKDYRVLSYAKKISGMFQRNKRPYLSKDAGAHLMDSYQWIIYKNRTI